MLFLDLLIQLIVLGLFVLLLLVAIRYVARFASKGWHEGKAEWEEERRMKMSRYDREFDGGESSEAD